MLKLLNRFAWILSLTTAFLASYIVDRNGLLDGDGFLIFLIVLFICKYLILSKKFIESRLEFFVKQVFLSKDDIKNSASNIVKDEKIQKDFNDLYDNQIINEEIKNDIKSEENLENDFIQKSKNNINENLQKLNKIKNEQNKHIQEAVKNISSNNNLNQSLENIEEKSSKIILFIKEFFSENILAKIGSILVFVGVLFLMTLIRNYIPPVLQIIIGFVIGFGIYVAGVFLDNKGYNKESKILLGTGILINFLVILAGKYIIGDNFGEGTGNLLGTGITFVFLILNTIFGIVTSFVYKSRTLLLFSFIFAYINPFLIGGNSDTPYVLVGYSMIVSLGALFIGIKNNDNILKYSSFVLGNLLFLIAPFHAEIGWIVKIFSSGILGLLTIFSLFNKDYKDNSIGKIFILNYIFIILQLSIGGDYGTIGSSLSYITYTISILGFFALGIFLFLSQSIISIIGLFLFPIIIFTFLIFGGIVNFIAPTLGIIVLCYFVGLIFIYNKISNVLKYLFFVLLGFFIFIINGYISLNHIFNSNTLNFSSFLITIIIFLVFLFISYFLSRKKGLEYLYIIGTICSIFIVLPIIVYGPIAKEMIISIVTIVIFGLSNQLLPFISPNLTNNKKNTLSLIISSVLGVLFIGGELYVYGYKYFPGVSLGICFVMLAILYFILGFIMMNKLGIKNVKHELAPRNTIYTYLFISISIFSLAMALVFSNHKEIISTIWLFEASILFYFYNKTKEIKIYVVGIILFIIGVFNMFTLLDLVKSKEFIFLIPFSIIGISFVFNLKNICFTKSTTVRFFHDIIHIIGIGILSALLFIIIPSTGYGWSLFGISLFLLVIGTIYSYFNSKILKIFFLFSFGYLMLLHVDEFSHFIWKIDKDEVGYLRVLQYFSTFILGIIVVLWNKFNKISLFNNIIKGLYFLYLIFILSFYVEDIFNNTFFVTMFWGIISSLYLFYGISINKIKYRTIGLYLGSGVLVKICYDIFFGIDNGIIKIIAIIGIGILLIIIGIQYTKRYGNNLKGEFNLDNLKDNEINDEKLNDEKIKDNEIKDNEIKDNEIKDDEIKDDEIKDNEIKDDEIKDNEIKDDEIKDNEIKDNEIKKKFILNEDLKINKKLNINKKLDIIENDKVSSIKEINVSNYKSVDIIFTDRTIRIRAINLLRIIKFVVDNLNGKTKFEPKELQNIFIHIKRNFKSDLSHDNYNKIIKIMKEFVEKGGEVIMNKK